MDGSTIGFAYDRGELPDSRADSQATLFQLTQTPNHYPPQYLQPEPGANPVMSENIATDFQDIVQALLNEDQLFSLNERRINARQNFVRPVKIVCYSRPKDTCSGFTRDLSGTGVGLIHKFEIAQDEQALITINRLWDGPVIVKCKVAWCTKTENGWFQSGWEILSVEDSSEIL